MRTLKSVSRDPQENVVEFLERYLEQAKAGEIRSVALAIVRGDNSRSNAWRINYRDTAELNLAIDGLKHAFVAAQTEGD